MKFPKNGDFGNFDPAQSELAENETLRELTAKCYEPARFISVPMNASITIMAPEL
jgi:hypothetical protein